eukprot:XP_001694633.1 predicted protein [Chlamydomonas reinhardtii]
MLPAHKPGQYVPSPYAPQALRHAYDGHLRRLPVDGRGPKKQCTSLAGYLWTGQGQRNSAQVWPCTSLAVRAQPRTSLAVRAQPRTSLAVRAQPANYGTEQGMQPRMRARARALGFASTHKPGQYVPSPYAPQALRHAYDGHLRRLPVDGRGPKKQRISQAVHKSGRAQVWPYMPSPYASQAPRHAYAAHKSGRTCPARTRPKLSAMPMPASCAGYLWTGEGPRNSAQVWPYVPSPAQVWPYVPSPAQVWPNRPLFTPSTHTPPPRLAGGNDAC